jgi:hypothetical protein
MADLAHGRERRIIKLHGTVGISEHFIFAEEDFRTYAKSQSFPIKRRWAASALLRMAVSGWFSS